jgi:hypothetical protein
MGEHSAENPVLKEAGTKDAVRCHIGDALMPLKTRIRTLGEELIHPPAKNN